MSVGWSPSPATHAWPWSSYLPYMSFSLLSYNRERITTLDSEMWQGTWLKARRVLGDFPGGPVVKNPPSKTRDVKSIPDQGTKIPLAAGQLNPCAATPEPACSGVHNENPVQQFFFFKCVCWNSQKSRWAPCRSCRTPKLSDHWAVPCLERCHGRTDSHPVSALITLGSDSHSKNPAGVSEGWPVCWRQGEGTWGIRGVGALSGPAFHKGESHEDMHKGADTLTPTPPPGRNAYENRMVVENKWDNTQRALSNLWEPSRWPINSSYYYCCN